MKPVLFASVKPLERAENLKALYDAYDGEKRFVKMDPWRRHPEIRSGKYELMVMDEFPTESPGKIILLGHGIEGGKTDGLDMPRAYYRKNEASLLTYVITTSEARVQQAAKKCGVNESIVLPYGMPRTDAYIGKKKGDGGTELALYRSYLYAPTYRSKEDPPLPDIAWGWLDEQLHDDELLVVKPHMMTKRILDGEYRHIKEVSHDEISAPYLYDCDVLLTDYSTIMFDAYLLNKPVVLIEKQEGYIQTRGMYLDYPSQYCSRYARNEEELLTLMRAADGLNRADRECIKMVAGACDGHASERICNLIKSLI